MTLHEALGRTLLLMRTDLNPGVRDQALLEALVSTRVVIRAGADVSATRSGQAAIVTAATLMARSGHEVWVDAHEAPLAGAQPPLPPGGLLAGLVAVGDDLLPGRAIRVGAPPDEVDVGVAFGAAEAPPAALRIGLDADDWWAGARGRGLDWSGRDWPMGGMAAGALAAGEAFKSAMRRLRSHARDAGYFDALYGYVDRPEARLAPAGTPLVSELPDFDIVSGGAIANAVLYALYRLPGVTGWGRVIDDDESALSNLNRNALLVRSALGLAKVEDLAARAAPGLAIQPVVERYRGRMPLAPTVLVGVDDIPSRWAVQRGCPDWLGVGATEGFNVNVSSHRPHQACVGCLHPVHLAGDGPIPTAAFVSFWAGLLLVARWLRVLAGREAGEEERQLYLSALRPDGWQWGAMPVAPNQSCPVGCGASRDRFRAA